MGAGERSWYHLLAMNSAPETLNGTHAVVVGTGFAGRAIARHLASEGCTVWATSRTDRGVAAIERAGHHGVRWDPTDDALSPRIEAGPWAGAVITFPPDRGPQDHSAVPTLEWLAELGVLRVVYVSSTSVFGGGDDRIVDAESPMDPDSDLGERRVRVIEALQARGEALGVHVVALHVPGIYGPGRNVALRIRDGRYRLVDGGQMFSNRIHVDDLATACRVAMQTDAPPSLLASDGHPFRVRELVEWTCDQLGASWLFEITIDEVLSFARTFWRGSKRCDPRHLLALGWRPKYPSFVEGLPACWQAELALPFHQAQRVRPMIGTPTTPSALRLLMLGAGELGKEVVIEAQRLGVEVIACDRYANAPAMQVAHRSHVVDMQDGDAIRRIIADEKPHFVVPEIEAIATDTLVALEAEGVHVVPTARATQLTMDREGIRRLAAEDLGLQTSPYRFAESLDELKAGAEAVGFPCVVKPVMSSSGKGQSVAKTAADVEGCWAYAIEGSRGKSARVIVEGFVDFDTEITLLTVRTRDEGTLFCPPVGHRQEGGDYQESWQPEVLSSAALAECERMAREVTNALGGQGLFGAEFFIRGDEVWFSEISPRPHDTGMVTMATQDMTEFELHVRAILGLPIGAITLRSPGASAVVLADAHGVNPRFEGVPKALAVDPRVKVRLFGKPDARPGRRMAVAVAYADTVDEARSLASTAAGHVTVHLSEPGE